VRFLIFTIFRATTVPVDQGIETAQKHFADQLESSGGKLSGCVHCAGIAIKQEWTNNMVDSIPNFEKMLKVNVSRLEWHVTHGGTVG